MVAAGKRPVLRIRAERRFGYRVPQPDGSVVEIQRRQEFVGYRELDPAQPFGVGFEERRRNQPVPVSDVAPLSLFKSCSSLPLLLCGPCSRWAPSAGASAGSAA